MVLCIYFRQKKEKQTEKKYYFKDLIIKVWRNAKLFYTDRKTFLGNQYKNRLCAFAIKAWR
ncbi:hypothetical protein CIL05_19815 [Virgibacillus profundi]|uniref:Uncharacterized protein n=1 Tax=Virgibacillus profundi TaxID=2024555 RepID=A0A2A2I9Y4_9BACI|nr:hypothetical protein CIL05_19815 [Virgibacillus profundi]PXY52108.1 hypothetical protein CIT14_19920 [Virgibacillus profundi]